MKTLANLFKAGAAIVVMPVTVVADILTLPASAHDDRHPFGNTMDMARAAKHCLDEATKPLKDTTHGR